MVDRIEKTDRVEVWQVSETSSTKDEKKRDENKNSRQQAMDSFGETSDFIQLLAKDPRQFKSERISSTQIQGFVFRGVSTHRDKALLEVDISMSNGTLIRGAQIAVTREVGMQYLSRRSGEDIVVDQLVKGTFLTIAMPSREYSKSPEATVAEVEMTEPVKVRLSWYYYLGLGAMFFATLLLIYFLLVSGK